MTDATTAQPKVHERDCPLGCGYRVRHSDEAGADGFLMEHLRAEHSEAPAPAMIGAAPDLRYANDAMSVPPPDCQCDRCLGIADPNLAAEVDRIIAAENAATPCD